MFVVNLEHSPFHHRVEGRGYSLSQSIMHVMTCKGGESPIMRHNYNNYVCHNVATEPLLQPLSGETFTYRSAIVGDEARLDIKARGFWNPTQCIINI